uniref:Uncharacterized protein n=1 Tax=Plectus sambesii TaxID=2011161 RepID=A0A914UYZ1_9BILA
MGPMRCTLRSSVIPSGSPTVDMIAPLSFSIMLPINMCAILLHSAVTAFPSTQQIEPIERANPVLVRKLPYPIVQATSQIDDDDDDRKFLALIEQALAEEQNSRHLVEPNKRHTDQPRSASPYKSSGADNNRDITMAVTFVWLAHYAF